MTNNLYFGILLTFIAYSIGLWINEKANKHPLANPQLIGIILTISFLLVFNIPYEHYQLGVGYITFFVAPATVALMINLYRNFHLLKRYIIPIVIGVTTGIIVHTFSVYFLCKLLNLDMLAFGAFVSKTVTIAIGVPLSEQLGAVISLTVIATIASGIYGSLVADMVFKVFHIKDPVAKGIGLGTASHALGTATAIDMGEIEGAMAGLSLAITGFLSVLIIPLLFQSLAL